MTPEERIDNIRAQRDKAMSQAAWGQLRAENAFLKLQVQTLQGMVEALRRQLARAPVKAAEAIFRGRK